jgi:hypothetical protein
VVRIFKHLPTLLCAGIACFFFWAGSRWIHDHRVDGLLEGDEAAYLRFSAATYLDLSKNGLLSWLYDIGSFTQAPLTTALTSLVFAAKGLDLYYGFLVPLAFATIAIVVTYMLVREISGPYAGLSAAALIATVPLIVNYSRNFHFAMPATAILALALLAAVKSGRFSKTGWSTAFGVFIGLLPLARTMTIAFVPGILFGAALNIASSKAISGRLIRFAAALCVAVLTAATWLAFTWKGVFGYLIGWGYGVRALEYGNAIPFFNVASLHRAIQLVTYAVYLFHFILITAGLGAGLIVACRVAYQFSWKAVRHAAKSPVLLLASTTFCGLAALMSSPNTGSAFVAPLLPPIIALAVCLLWAAWQAPLYRAAVGTISVGVAVIVVLPFLGVYSILPKQKAIALPFIGSIGVSDDRGTIDFDLDNSSQLPIGRDKSEWVNLIAHTNAAISRQPESAIAVGFRHGIYSASPLEFDYLVKTGRGRQFISPDPGGSSNTAQGYRDWLSTGAAAHARLLMTSPGSDGEPLPLVDNAAMEEAARSLGFQPVDGWTMPNGRPVTLWKR